MQNPGERIREIDERLEQLPKGTLTYKTINGKKQPYVQQTIEGKSVSYYVKLTEREQILMEFEERSRLQKEKQRLIAYMKSLEDILKKNPYLGANVGCGYQNFRDFACGKQFYVDKTHFITEWMNHDAKVTLLTRPRRFGKTTLLSTVENFFDPRFSGHPEYFEKLRVWQDERARSCYGTVPVIMTSFGSCKGRNYQQSIKGLTFSMYTMYELHGELQKSQQLTPEDIEKYKNIRDALFAGDTTKIETAIPALCALLYKHYGIMPYILLDEYDTPLLEAYTDGYWDEMISTCRQLFHGAFKENEFYSRAIITGVTRVSKNSLFSDMNNIEVHTVTSAAYQDCCGFTEQEVSDALKCQNYDCLPEVKAMYDGFIFGGQRDIYNPWSICGFLRHGEFVSYWINTSSNKLIGEIIRRHPIKSKYEIEQLMSGAVVHKKINENITFQYLDGDENSLWSLLLAVGYIKADNVIKNEEITECDVSVTNREVMGMFRNEILGMFHNGISLCNEFVEALMKHDVDDLTYVLEDITYGSMSYFDVADGPADRMPENFYHGLVLGLIVCLKDQYRIVSNRESGRGRYDIAMYPKQPDLDAFIMEFKVYNSRKESSLEQTAENALKQIEEKAYEKDLLAEGIPKENIYKLGFAFKEKDVCILHEKSGKN